MKLINRYVNEVGKNLPLLTGREDIEKELKSTLEDMLEERAEKAGRPADEAMEIELLKEYGAPFDVAMTYNPQPYLIGPRLFPSFLSVIKIVVPIVVTVLLVLTGIRAGTETQFLAPDYVEAIFDGLGDVIYGAIMAVGNIAIVFAVLERVYPHAKLEELEEGKMWEPESLSKEPDPDSVKRGDLIGEIIFTLIGLAVINGIFETPIFSDEFQKFVPWINAIFITEVLLNFYLIRKAVWDTGTRLVKIVMETGMIVIAYLILKTPNLIGFTAEAFTNNPENSSFDFDAAMGIFNLSVSITLVIVIIVSAVDLGKAVIGLVRSRTK
jgi:hypothetical protein